MEKLSNYNKIPIIQYKDSLWIMTSLTFHQLEPKQTFFWEGFTRPTVLSVSRETTLVCLLDIASPGERELRDWGFAESLMHPTVFWQRNVLMCTIRCPWKLVTMVYVTHFTGRIQPTYEIIHLPSPGRTSQYLFWQWSFHLSLHHHLPLPATTPLIGSITPIAHCWWFRNPKANHVLDDVRPCK